MAYTKCSYIGKQQSKNTSIKLYEQGKSSNNHHGTKFQFCQQPGGVNHLRYASRRQLKSISKRYTNVETRDFNRALPPPTQARTAVSRVWPRGGEHCPQETAKKNFNSPLLWYRRRNLTARGSPRRQSCCNRGLDSRTPQQRLGSSVKMAMR